MICTAGMGIQYNVVAEDRLDRHETANRIRDGSRCSHAELAGIELVNLYCFTLSVLHLSNKAYRSLKFISHCAITLCCPIIGDQKQAQLHKLNKRDQ